MGCSGSRKEATHVVLRKVNKHKNIVNLFNQCDSWDLGVKVMQYLSLVELGRISAVCKCFYRITGNEKLLQKYGKNIQIRKQSIHSSNGKYTFVNKAAQSSKEYDFITDQQCKVESNFPLNAPKASLHNSVVTPKFATHPPAMNDTIKNNIINYECNFKYAKSKEVDIPGHIFSVTDSLENPQAYAGMEAMIKQKSIVKTIKNTTLSGV